MKQTVEEAAKDYLQGILETTDFEVNFNEDNYDAGARDALFDVTERSFIAGAEWQAKQSPWISVEERLPEHHSSVVFYSFKHGLLAVNAEHITEEDIEPMGITHWCYISIPTFGQILEANKDVLQRMKEKGD